MNGNTSAIGGFLTPTSPLPIEDVALEDVITATVAGITGIDPTLVRPRWQPSPPKEPEYCIDWCGVGVLNETPDAGLPSIIHNPADNGGLGSSTTYQQSILEIMASFYGPNARGLASLLRDGLMVSQNREAMAALDMALVSKPGESRRVPELINNIWRNRVDVSFSVRRNVKRTWAIESALSVPVTITGDDGTSQSFTVTGPTPQAF